VGPHGFAQGDYVTVDGVKHTVYEDLPGGVTVIAPGGEMTMVPPQDVDLYDPKSPPAIPGQAPNIMPVAQSPLKPYSPKSKAGHGYKFADLGDLAPDLEFRDKSGALWRVTGKTTDGLYVRFVKLDADGNEVSPVVVYQHHAGARVRVK
jgi:hypothetical protein